MTLRSRNVILGLLALVLLGVSIKVGIDFARMLAWQFAGPMHGDAPVYMMLGRGIMNGLAPYVDLFDTKPPGMFLLMIISLVFTKGEMLMTWLQTATFVLTPLLCMWFAYRATGKERSLRTLVILLTVFLATSVMMFYTEERSTGLQPEGIGFFASFLYAMLLLHSNIRSWKSITAAAACMVFSMGLKEPFLVTNFAVALLLTPRWKDLLYTFVIPLMVASLAGVVVLIALGILVPFLTVHLPDMLVYRTASGEYDPMWLRGINAYRIYGNMISYYPTGKYTGYLVLALAMCTPVLLLRRVTATVWVACSAVAVLASWFALNLLYTVTYLTHNNPGQTLTIPGSQWAWVIASVITLLGLWRWRPTLLKYTLLTIVTLYLAFFTIASGANYHPNFFIFAMPIYLGFLLLWIEGTAKDSTPLPIQGVVIVIAILAGIYYQQDPKHLKDLQYMVTLNYEHGHENAEHLDAIMNACNIQRYANGVGNSGFWFATHSPWGPMHSISIPRFLPPDHPYGKITLDNIRNNPGILLYDEEEKPRIVGLLPDMMEYFTEEAPDCAKPFLPFRDYTVLFNKKNASVISSHVMSSGDEIGGEKDTNEATTGAASSAALE